MKHFRYLTLACAATAGAGTLSADVWNKKTVITVGETITLPTATLQPGTYVMKLLDSNSNRHIVQVFEQDEKKIITTILAIPNYRLQPTGKTTLQFWETPAGEPPALRAWFYPGDNFGQEFVYPRGLAMMLASRSKQTVPTMAAENADEFRSTTVSSVDESGKSAELDSKIYRREESTTVAVAQPEPEPAPATVAAARPEPEPVEAAVVEAPAEEARRLPDTASELPPIALIGLLSLGAFAAVTARLKLRG